MKRIAVLSVGLLGLSPAWGQVNQGELRLKLTDPSGAALRGSVEISSTGAGYDKTLATDALGSLTVKELPFGMYRVTIRQQGFAPASRAVDIDSAIPKEEDIRLSLASVVTQMNVTGANTAIDPGSSRSADADWCGRNPASAFVIAGQVGAGPGELAAGLAV